MFRFVCESGYKFILKIDTFANNFNKTFMKRVLAYFFIVFVMASCSKKVTFTQSEIDIINNRDSSLIMPLFTVDDPADTSVLRAVAADLSEADIQSDLFKALKERMLATVQDTTNEGVGIAAPQVGVSKRLVIVQRFDKPGEPFEFYPNIRIIEYSDEKQLGKEGCLSVPNRSEEVERSKRVVFTYLDENSLKMVKDSVDGFTAVIFQHEVDHLEGVIYIDRVKTK